MIPEDGLPSQFFLNHGISSVYLLSIDLEDIRAQSPEGSRFPSRVARLTDRFLEFFEKHGIRVTFFIVGQAAAENPGLVRRISAAGHEIACHSLDHKSLDQTAPEDFKNDLKRNKEILFDLGCPEVIGFRAPDFSLTEKTKWAWDVLAELGFRYSSSVLPAKNPRHGWKGYPRTPVFIRQKIWSFPISITPTPGWQIPFTGGVYLRVLPKSAIMRFSRWYKRRSFPVVGYLHPYDIDPDQEKFKIESNRFYNGLVYYNRNSVFKKITCLIDHFPVLTFSEYLKRIEAAGCRNGERHAGFSIA